jgi:hypothetical protein
MLVRKHLQTKAVIGLAALALLAGCGQNANIARKGTLPAPAQLNNGPAPDTAMQPQQQPEVVQQPQAPILPEGGIEPQLVPAPTGGSGTQIVAIDEYKIDIHGVAGQAPAATEYVTGPQGPEGPAGPAGAVGPAGPAGESAQGRDGLNGLNGAKGDTVCGPVPRVLRFPGVATKPSYYANIPLPYYNPTGWKKTKIQTLMQGRRNKRHKQLRYTQDAQVLFEVNVKLPPAEAVEAIEYAFLNMDMLKLSKDNFHDTELLCFMDHKICSGAHFHNNEGGWEKNVNPEFWNSKDRILANGMFSDLAIGNAVDSFKGKSVKVGGRRIRPIWTLWESEQSIALSDLLKDSEIKSFMQFFYGDQDRTKPLDRTIHMVVADDTYVSRPNLEIRYIENTCLTQKTIVPSTPAGEPAPTGAQAPAAQPAPAVSPGPAPAEAKATQ